MTTAILPRTAVAARSYARGVSAGLRRELRELRRSPDRLMALVTAPLLTLVFVAIMLNNGRDDLAPYAVLAPALLVLWQMALQTSGDTVEAERENGSLEALVAAPSSFPAVIAGRILAVTAVSMLGFAESWAVAALVGVRVAIVHPGVFVGALVVTAFATACSALALAALFVRTRAARAFQNTLTYPFYILGGVMVPVEFLPDWIEPLTRLVFLSWSSDLIRQSLLPGPVQGLAEHVVAIVLLGVVSCAIGGFLIRLALREVRESGTIGHA
ncbi:MAG TPA: ABC transporter permease [Actinotalea caeni]|uniref:ABC transporter permease n=1 Tax=Actinotalea caeni TaxID=1348467 RepID=UPI0012E284E0|nr:ABC transporter permease [Actinotalea caeni]HLV55541.1 ABC transporter permease [Actinotalea caeni]